MCEVLLQNYSSFINNLSDETTDIITTMLFFNGTNCTELMYPFDPINAGFPTTDVFPIDSKVLLPLGSQVNSFFIPFNITSVKFIGPTGYTSTFQGPLFISDTSLINWQVGTPTKSMASTTGEIIDYIQVLSKRDWNETIPEMCMGQLHSIGSNFLSRYYGQSQRCDYFMTNQYCVGDNLTSKEVCGCFNDLPEVKEKSEKLGVMLPVLCFGESCATKRTYKTQSMLSKPCNMTIFQKIIQTSGGVFGNIDAKIMCSGNFYTNTGDFIPDQASIIPNVNDVNPPTSDTWINAVILAVSVVILGFLVLIMFSSTRKKQDVNDNQMIIPDKAIIKKYQ